MTRSSSRRTILVLDDDELFCDATREFLAGPDRTIFGAGTGKEGIAACESRQVDVVLLDQNLPDAEGHTLCSRILECNESCKIIFITAHPSFEGAVQAIRAGADDYLSKPFEPDELALAVDRALRTLDLEDVALVARYQSQQEERKAVLVGAEQGLAETAKLVSLAATTDAPVLITGETGTGKNVAAKVIHFAGPRKERPFIPVNCAALPETLIEAELFGHEKGAFTGAVGRRRGVFEMAQGGTLFLDEIGEMPVHLQPRLLSVLEDQEVRRLGSESSIPVDVRIVAATGLDLEHALGSTFRRDLFFRLSVMTIKMPALRERKEDISALCEHFLRDARGADWTILEAEMNRLQAYDWPGNVRELRNVLERATIVQQGSILRPSELLGAYATLDGDTVSQNEELVRDGDLELADVERRHIRFVLGLIDNNYTQTAKALGVALSTLKRKLDKYDLR